MNSRNKPKRIPLLVILLLTRVAGGADIIPFAGTWQFQFDPENIGVDKRWFTETLEDSVTLPGTTDTNQRGVFKDERAVDRLSRVWYWKGPAWYQREVVIPDSWQGKRITMLLERSKTTRVWVNHAGVGERQGWRRGRHAQRTTDLRSHPRPDARSSYAHRAGG